MEFELHPDLQRDGILLGSFPLNLVLLINDRRYPWFVLVPQRPQLKELYDLADSDYEQYGRESRLFSRAIMQAFQGFKLNVAALGNMTPQLHIHHVVRQDSDAAWPKPIWGVGNLEPYDENEIDKIRSLLNNFELPEFSMK